MRLVLLLILMLMCASVSGKNEDTSNKPIPKRLWTPRARLLGLQSALGEVGWGDKANPEQAEHEWVSVMGVYGKRAKAHGTSLTYMIKNYSAAVKKPNRAWIVELTLNGQKPPSWPSRLRWGVHKPILKRALATIDAWAAGNVKSLTPYANHFGGDMDRHRADARCWGTVQAPEYFGNTFYNSNWKRPNCRVTVRDKPRPKIDTQNIDGVGMDLIKFHRETNPNFKN